MTENTRRLKEVGKKRFKVMMRKSRAHKLIDRSVEIEHFSRSQSGRVVMTEKNAAETTAEDASKTPDAKKFQIPPPKAMALHKFPESLDACSGRKLRGEMSKLAKVKSKMTMCLSVGFLIRRA